MARMTSFQVVESHLRKPTLSASDWEEIVMLTENPELPSNHILADGILTPSKWEEIARLIQTSASRLGITLGREAPAKTWSSKAVSIFNKIGPRGRLAAQHIDKVPSPVLRLLIGRTAGPYSSLSVASLREQQFGHNLIPGTTRTKASWTSEEVYEEEILERFRDYLPGCDCRMCAKFRSTAESDIRMKRFSEAIETFNKTFFAADHDPRSEVESYPHWATPVGGAWADFEPYAGHPGIRAGFTRDMGVDRLSEIPTIVEPLAAPAIPAPPRRARRTRAHGDEISAEDLAQSLARETPEPDIPF